MRCVVIASRWLLRNPSMPRAVDPTAIRTPGIWSVTSSRRRRSGAALPGIHTQRVAALAITLSGCCASAVRTNASVARSNWLDSASSLQTTAAVWDCSRRYPRRASARCLLIGAPSRISATASRRSAWVPRVSSSRST